MLRAWRRHSTVTMTAAGCGAVVAAVLLSAAPRSVIAFSDAAALHIDGATLRRDAVSPVSGYVAYSGDASVLVEGSGRATRVAGAATISGVVTTGRCAAQGSATGSVTERCEFKLGGTSLTSLDVFDPQARSWRRTYSDGVSLVIQVPNGGTPVPIPLPLGR